MIVSKIYSTLGSNSASINILFKLCTLKVFMRRELLRADCLNMEWVTGWIAKLFGKCGERPEIEIKAGMRGCASQKTYIALLV